MNLQILVDCYPNAECILYIMNMSNEEDEIVQILPCYSIIERRSRQDNSNFPYRVQPPIHPIRGGHTAVRHGENSNDAVDHHGGQLLVMNMDVTAPHIVHSLYGESAEAGYYGPSSR